MHVGGSRDPFSCGVVFLSGAGKHANFEGLAQAVTYYWSMLEPEDSESPALADRGLAPRIAREWFRQIGYR